MIIVSKHIAINSGGKVVDRRTDCEIGDDVVAHRFQLEAGTSSTALGSGAKLQKFHRGDITLRRVTEKSGAVWWDTGGAAAPAEERTER